MKGEASINIREVLNDVGLVRPHRMVNDNQAFVYHDCSTMKVESTISFLKGEWNFLDDLVNEHFNCTAPIVTRLINKGLSLPRPLDQAISKFDHVDDESFPRKFDDSDLPTFTMMQIPLPIYRLKVPTQLLVPPEDDNTIQINVMEAGMKMGKIMESNFLRKLRELEKPVVSHKEAIETLRSFHFYGPYTLIDDGISQYLMQATTDVVDIIIGLTPTLVVWNNALELWCVMASRFRKNVDSNVGVVRLC